MISTTSPRYFRTPLFFRRVKIIGLVLIIGIALFPFSAHTFDIRLGTGEQGTFSHFTGRILCRAINSHPSDLNCQTEPASDDVHNLTNLRGGSLDIAIVDSRMLLDAMNKTGHFKFLDISYENLRIIAPLYNIPITLVVRNDAGITQLKDLKGKRINAGTTRSLQYLAVDTIMKTKKWSKKDFTLFGELPPSQSQDTMAFCHGTMQAMVHIGVHPDSSLKQLFKLCKADLVSMDDSDIEKMVNDHPAFWRINIAANTYPSHPEEVTTFGTRAILVTSENLDNQTVYQVIEAIDRNQKRLTTAHPALSLFYADSTKNNVAGIKLHTGAAKYFSER
ncbi:MAG: TAXI family TRAP transporter solute-binding subunit [Desulfobacterales bacterium]|nr:TAXI family TRAP transporter solute-binding subunit [Desulfobacterales bacterium]